MGRALKVERLLEIGIQVSWSAELRQRFRANTHRSRVCGWSRATVTGVTDIGASRRESRSNQQGDPSRVRFCRSWTCSRILIREGQGVNTHVSA